LTRQRALYSFACIPPPARCLHTTQACWARAARTDKGVSAAANILSLDLMGAQPRGPQPQGPQPGACPPHIEGPQPPAVEGRLPSEGQPQPVGPSVSGVEGLDGLQER
jgi:hypothetical protein